MTEQWDYGQRRRCRACKEVYICIDAPDPHLLAEHPPDRTETTIDSWWCKPCYHERDGGK